MKNQKTWTTDENIPSINKGMVPSQSPDEISLPSSEWSWATNGQLEAKIGKTNPEGWEFAGKFPIFKSLTRKPKPEKAWNSRVRRRMWSKVDSWHLTSACLAQVDLSHY